MPQLEIFEFDILDSTNNFLYKQLPSNKNQLCITNKQTKGRGQYNRSWLTEEQQALFSIKTKFSTVTNISGLSLIIALAILKILKNNYKLQELAIKWPNDIYIKNKKLAGILIENQVIGNIQYIIIGIGINIISNNFGSIGYTLDKKVLILTIADKIFTYLEKFTTTGFNYFAAKWQQYDYLIQNKIKIKYNNAIYLSAGVDDNGFLLLINNNKTTTIYNSKEIITDKCNIL